MNLGTAASEAESRMSEVTGLLRDSASEALVRDAIRELSASVDSLMETAGIQ